MRLKLFALLIIVSFSVASQAELHDRGGGIIYDEILDITWLQDATAGAGTSYDDGSNTSDGLMTWDNAVAWADTLVFGGFDDWRLPSMDVNDDDTVVYCDEASEVACRDNELGYMFYQNLMGSYGDNLTGTQDLFTNVQYLHFSGTEDTPHSGLAWGFVFDVGAQGGVLKDIGYGAWAVRAGDVGPDFDGDGDGVAIAMDNCTLVPNPTQCDGDSDGYGNHCDADFNQDLIVNGLDIGPFKIGFGTTNPVTDLNCDGITNGLDVGLLRVLFGSPPGPSGLVP